MVTILSVLFTVLGMLGVTVLKEWFDDERRRRDHQRAIKVQVLNEFQLIIDAMNSIVAKFPAAPDLESHAANMSSYVQTFNRSVAAIEALDPAQQVIDDLYEAHNLVLNMAERYLAGWGVDRSKLDQLHRLTVSLKKHQIKLNETIW